MLQLPILGPIVTILLSLALSGVLSWGATQMVKVVILWWDATHHEKWWFNIVIRAFATCVGLYVGYLILPGVVGAAIGAAGGILNTTIVAVVKSKLKSFDPNVTQPSYEPGDIMTPSGVIVQSPDGDH